MLWCFRKRQPHSTWNELAFLFWTVTAAVTTTATQAVLGINGDHDDTTGEWLNNIHRNRHEQTTRHSGPLLRSGYNEKNLEPSHFTSTNTKQQGPPSWEELDRRVVPSWYDEAKFGIFLHWGVFSVPALCSEWFGTYWRNHWGPCAAQIASIMNGTERPKFAYQEFASRFQAELYNATEWSRVFARSGAQYVVLTSKHHEGYCMWDSTDIATTWQWNVMDVGPRRDLLGELAQAVKKETSPHTGRFIKFGVYHSLYEWFNPLYRQDQSNNFTTNHFVTLKTMAELRQLVERYHPELIWSDGEWEAHSDYWQAREFLHWYSTQVTTGVWNDRWGTDTLCHHGDFVTCTDRYNPGHLVNKKWENALTIDKSSWGWNRLSNYDDYLTTKELINSLIETVAFNGNFLLNVGPSADGTLNPIFMDRLVGMGEWLAVNGAAIYNTRPWDQCQIEPPPSLPMKMTPFGKSPEGDTPSSPVVYYTRTSDLLFVHLTEWPPGNQILLSCPQPSEDTIITLLGLSDTTTDPLNEARPKSPTPSAALTWSVRQGGRGDPGGGGLLVTLPPLTPDIIPCQHAWVLQLTNVANLNDGHDNQATTIT
ncbi:hypothetical protein ACA910_021932 [Epithemia clementina (nom. ined.)]